MAKGEDMSSFPVGPALFYSLLVRWSQMDIMRCTCSKCGRVSSPQTQVLFSWHCGWTLPPEGSSALPGLGWKASHITSPCAGGHRASGMSRASGAFGLPTLRPREGSQDSDWRFTWEGELGIAWTQGKCQRPLDARDWRDRTTGLLGRSRAG